MPELEGICEEYLLNKITSQNVIRITKLAKRSELKDLQQSVLKFIKAFPNVIFEAIE